MASCTRIPKRSASCAWSHTGYLHANLTRVGLYYNSQTGYAAVNVRKGYTVLKYTHLRSAGLKFLLKRDSFRENLIQYIAAKERNAVGGFPSLLPEH